MIHQKPEILFIQSGFPKLSATFILDQMIGLINRGVSIENWATYNPKEDIVHPTISKYNFDKTCRYLSTPTQKPLNSDKDWLSEFKVRNLAFSLDGIKTVHIHFGLNYNLISPLLRNWNGRLIVSFYGHDATRYVVLNGTACYAELFQRANLITTPTYIMKAHLEKLGCPPEKVIVHRCGVDLQTYSPVIKDEAPRKIRILTTARLVGKKGLNSPSEHSLKSIQTYTNTILLEMDLSMNI